MTRPCLWCSNCGGTFADLDPALNAPVRRCPLCDGSGFDTYRWDVARRDYPHFPEQPDPGARYEAPADGMYFTPAHILDIIEPSMGSGAFLAELAQNPPWGHS